MEIKSSLDTPSLDTPSLETPSLETLGLETQRGADGDRQAKSEKRAYSAPELIQWGTIFDLTGNILNGTQDGFFSGTEPT